MSHTKGPWKYRKAEKNDSYAVFFIDHEGEEQILTHGGCGCCNYDDESIDKEDDARLMSAAPDLLEALELVLKCEKWHAAMADVVTEEARTAIGKADAAIAKARGDNAK